MKVKIGDKIRHSLFGGEVCTGVVEDMQICKQGEKEGRSVNSADVEKHHGVIDLDNGHWCYFDQVINIINQRTMADTKRMTMKYWDSLSEDSRYRALRKVFSNFPDSSNRDFAKQQAKELSWMWDLIKRHVKQPTDNSHYKTVIDRTWIP